MCSIIPHLSKVECEPAHLCMKGHARLKTLIPSLIQISVLWMVWPMRWTKPSASSTRKDTRWTAPASDRGAAAGNATPSVSWSHDHLNIANFHRVVSQPQCFYEEALIRPSKSFCYGLWPQTSARSRRRGPSFRLGNLGIKSYMASCTSAFAMATALGSSAASLSSPTQVRRISVLLYLICLTSYCYFYYCFIIFFHCLHKSKQFADVTLKTGALTLMWNRQRWQRGCYFLFSRNTSHPEPLFLLACGAAPMLLPQLYKTANRMCVCLCSAPVKPHGDSLTDWTSFTFLS